MQWSIDKGMVEYVISKEIETLQPALTQITDKYKVENNGPYLAGKHRRFHHLITQQLANSDLDVERNFPPTQDITDKSASINHGFKLNQQKIDLHLAITILLTYLLARQNLKQSMHY
jgi:two-component system sensor histidine kinase BaeS